MGISLSPARATSQSGRLRMRAEHLIGSRFGKLLHLMSVLTVNEEGGHFGPNSGERVTEPCLDGNEQVLS